MAKVVLGVGSNMGQRHQNLQEAINAFKLIPGVEVLKASSIYQTAPIGFLDQQDFFNGVFMIETDFSPSAVLGFCLGIEAAMGRRRTVKDGPRIIDIDVLLYENIKTDNHELTLPHPRMFERRFVLEPLKDIFPDGAMGRYFNAELESVSDQQLTKTIYDLRV